MRAILPAFGLFLFSAALLAHVTTNDEDGAPAFDASWNGALQWRSIGPANMGGRVVALAVVEGDPCIYWIGTASGGLLKTTNAGVTYEHQFDHESTVSVGDVAVAPSNPDVVWVGTGEANPRNSVSYGDGVHRSVDGGKTWKHMGLEQTFQLGRIQVHPSNPDVVYVGALGRLYGPNEERGLFKTSDGGKSWEKILYVDERTGVIDIDFHPTDPETLLVATYERQRDLYDSNDPSKKWGPGGGIHKTSDGGKSWRKITSGLPEVQLGRIGIDWYRKDPNVVFAVVETERIARLPDDAAYLGLATEDAEVGARVERVTDGSPAAEAGLKEQDIVLLIDDKPILTDSALGFALRERKAGDKIVLEYVREKQLMRAEIELVSRPKDAEQESPFGSGLGGQRENVHSEQGRGALQTGGIFKSTDAGETWTRINSLNPRPMYFSQIRVDPSDEKYVYVLGISLYRSEDGGATFTPDGHGPEVHVDHHALWIDPRDGRHIFLGNDGGFYVSHDRMKHWDYHNHVAIGQFYHVAVDSRRDYYVYGGLQDNGSWGGPSRSTHREASINSDWIRVGGGDGFVCAVDPEDPDLVYYESQNGGLGRLNLSTGEGGFMRPRGIKGVRYRFNWKTPFQLSHHNSRMFYCAGSYVFRSFDRGQELEPISPQITRTDRGSATAIAESRHSAATLWVGTDDGALWRSSDLGASWTDLFDFAKPARTLAQEEAEREAAAAEKKAAEKAAEEEEKAKEEAAAGETEAAAAEPRDPVAGEWKGKLLGEGIPAEGSEFRLIVTRADPGGSLEVELASEKLSAKGGVASFDPASGALTVDLDSQAGRIHLTATVEGEKMSGKLSVAGGLFQLSFEAERGGPDEPPALPSSPGSESSPPQGPTPVTEDPVAGEWNAELVGDDVPSGAAGFQILLRRDAAGKIEGSTSSERGDGVVESATFDPATGKLALSLRSERGTFTIEAVIEGDTMKGTLTVGGGAFTLDFEAERARKAPVAEPPPAPPTAPVTEPPPAPTTAPETQTESETAAEKPPPPEGSLAALLPKPMCVSSIEPSHHEEGRLYVTFDGHRSDDDDPWVFASEDAGETWESLRANLPRGSSRVLREDPINEDVLYLGTEFGVWVTIDRGKSWTRLEGVFPTVAVHDFAFSPAVPEMVVATHGRSLWVLDMSVIRQMTEEVREKQVWLFEPTTGVRTQRPPERGESGTRRFLGENPSQEAALYYVLRSRAKEVKLSILELSGEPVRELEVPDDSGLHRITWDLRREGRPIEGRPADRPSRGRSVPAGRYTVVLTVDGARFEQPITIEDLDPTPDRAESDEAGEPD